MAQDQRGELFTDGERVNLHVLVLELERLHRAGRSLEGNLFSGMKLHPHQFAAQSRL